MKRNGNALLKRYTEPTLKKSHAIGQAALRPEIIVTVTIIRAFLTR